MPAADSSFSIRGLAGASISLPERSYLVAEFLKVGDFEQRLEITRAILRPRREHVAERMLRQHRAQRRLR